MSNSRGFGIVRSNDWGAGRAAFEELCRLASVASGLTFVPDVVTSYAELNAAVRALAHRGHRRGARR